MVRTSNFLDACTFSTVYILIATFTSEFFSVALLHVAETSTLLKTLVMLQINLFNKCVYK